MTETGWERWGAACGLALLLVGAAGTALERGAPKVTAPAAKVAQFFADNWTTLVAQSIVFVIGAGVFLWFLGSLRSYLARTETGAARLATVAFGAGVAWVAIHAAAQAVQSGMAIAAHNAASKEMLAALYPTGYALFTLADVPLAVMLFATGVLALRTGAFPAWLGWLSVATGVVHLAMPFGLLAESGPLASGGWLTYVQYPLFAVWLLCVTTVMLIELGRPVRRIAVPQKIAAPTAHAHGNGHKVAPTRRR